MRVQSVQNILRDRGDGTITSGTELTATHLYASSGIKTLRQTLFLQNAQPLENIITFFVENPFKSHSIALNVVGSQFSYPQAHPIKFSLSLLPTVVSTPISITNTFAVNQSQTFSAIPISKIALQYSYPDAGTKSITSYGKINRCVALFNQGTVYISAEDRCLTALNNGTLKQYKCDMDSDGIPDICDDDMDGDDKKNLLGIITYEKADCSYNSDNVDESILGKHFGVCSLDNCPFTKNPSQSDLNNNGIGDGCEAWTQTIIAAPGASDTLWKYDQDKDGIPDDLDLCPTIPGDSAHQGCPSLGGGSTTDLCESAVPTTCGDGNLDPEETCLTCPEDAGFTCFVCGNSTCELGESNVNCPADCPPTNEKCGNGIIDAGETCRDCPADT
ncbi:MAG: thrombospondin type 3 repeat-containing protein [Candidatus Peribacteria bacterium]|nr:thrombospondin type 3 repeat-containing protein [Candidatus Peribacteria bacterium]